VIGTRPPGDVLSEDVISKRGTRTMPDRVYKKISVTGCSDESIEKAIRVAVTKASESLRGLSWFEVKELRGSIRDGGTLEYQASVEVAFKVD